MALTKYTYSITNDFPNQAVDITKLTVEIGESTIVTALSHINTDGDVCDIHFSDALSGGDETVLDGLVAAHDGEALDDSTNPISTGSVPDSTNSTIWLDPVSNSFYCFDPVRNSWLSSNKDYPLFSKTGSASGMYLPLVTDFSMSSSASAVGDASTTVSLDDAYMPGKPSTITSIFCRSKRGAKDKQFAIKKNGGIIFTFEYDNSGDLIYNNSDLNLEIDSYDEIQIYVYKDKAGVVNTICRLEITWRYEE